MMALFDGYKSASGTHGEPNRDANGIKWSIKKTAKTVSMPVTAELWMKHLSGERPLGVVPIRSDDSCIWGSVDVDKYNIDLLEVVKRVKAMKLPLVPCRSKSGGLHLFMFTKEPVTASAMQLTLRNLAATLGFADSEIFPKQTKILDEQGDSGSWMVMPYYGDTFGGKLKFQRGLKETGAEMTVEEFLNFAERHRVTEEDMAQLRSRSVPEEQGGPPRKKRANGKSVAYGDGPPCLQFMAESGFPEGGRNNALFHIGVYLKKAEPTKWKELLESDNQKYMRPPLPSEEVEQVKKSLEKKDYEYKCKDQPMASHCDSIMCRSRKYGVGNDVFPQITSVRKVESEPPVWFVDIDTPEGTKTLRLKTEEFQYYHHFQRHCMEVATVIFKHLPQNIWNIIMMDAMANTEIHLPPPDLRAGGRFRELMETFLTNRTRGLTKEDLLRGASWEDEDGGRFYFRLADLNKFMEREGIKLSRSELTSLIKRMHNTFDDEGELVGENMANKVDFNPHVGMRIKTNYVNTWWVPSSVVQRAPELDAPELPKENL